MANDPEIYFETRVNVKGRRAKVSLDIILILVCDALFVRSVADYRTQLSQIVCRYIGCS